MASLKPRTKKQVSFFRNGLAMAVALSAWPALSQVGGAAGTEDPNAVKLNTVTKLDFHSGNLVSNGSFENGTQGWYPAGVKWYLMADKSMTAYTGRNGMDFQIPIGHNGTGGTCDPFLVKSNTDYTLSFYYKAPALNAGHDVHPALYVTGGPTLTATDIYPCPNYGVVSGWTLYSATIHVNNGGMANLVMTIGTGKNTAVTDLYLDDVLLVEGTANLQSKTGKSVAFIDGLNRPLQSVIHEGSLDAVSETRYDDLGRIKQTSLPVGNLGNHTYIPNMFDGSAPALNAFYNAGNLNAGGYAFSQVKYENSPLGRVIETIPNGFDWATTGHSVKKYYGSTDKVPTTWKSGDALTIDNSHLSVEMMEGADGQLDRSFTDRLGRVVKTQSKLGSKWIESTTGYDALGRVIEEVAPPNADGFKISSTYAYNSLGRTMTEDIPGVGWTDFRYDRGGNLRFKQTRNQYYVAQFFTYYKYDVFNRIIEEGEFQNASYFTESAANILDFPEASRSDVKVHTRYFYDNVPKLRSYCSEGPGVENILIYPGANTNSASEFKSLESAISTLNVRFAEQTSYDRKLRLFQSFESASSVVTPSIGFQIAPFQLGSSSEKVPFTLTGMVKGSAEHSLMFGGDFPFAVSWGPLKGKLVQVVHCNTELEGSPVGVKDISKTFNYDKYGNVTAIFEYNGYMKDPSKRWQKSEQEFDAQNRVVQRRVYPHAGSTVAATRLRYAYDHRGRIDEIFDLGLNTITAKHYYNSLGQLTKAEVGPAGAGRVIFTYQYTFQGWPKTISAATQGGKWLYDQVLNYQNGSQFPKFNGNVSSYNYSLMTLSGAGKSSTYQFQYDQMDRLVWSATGMFPQGGSTDYRYAYNDNGTLKERDENGALYKYNYYTGTDMLNSVVGSGPVSPRNASAQDNFQFDASGRLRSDKSRNLTDVRYDEVRDRPSQFNWDGGTDDPGKYSNAYMVYDESGNRVSKISYLNGVLTDASHYTSSGKEVRDIKTGAAPPQSEYIVKEVYPFDGLGRIAVTPVTYHYEAFVKNSLGSTVMVYNVNLNTPVFRADYEPFGEMKIRERTASDEITQKFTGKEHDDGTNLDYFGARYYDADMGIWISPDAQRQFHGPYTYAGNGTSPTNGVDKDGNLLVIGAVVGGVGGAACGMLSVWYSDNLNIWQAGMIVASSAAGGVVMGTLDPSMGIGTVMAIGAATGVTTQYLENVAKGKANPLKWDGGDYGEIAASGVLGAVVPGAGKVVGKAIEPTIPVLKAGMKATSAKGMKVVAEIAKAKSMAKAGDQAMDFVETGVDILLTSKKEGAFSN